MKFLSNMYISPWVGKNFRFTVCRLLENVFPSLEFTICSVGIIKKLSTLNFYTKSRFFYPFYQKHVHLPRWANFQKLPTLRLLINGGSKYNMAQCTINVSTSQHLRSFNHLKVHLCRSENLPICFFFSYNNNTLKIPKNSWIICPWSLQIPWKVG